MMDEKELHVQIQRAQWGLVVPLLVLIAALLAALAVILITPVLAPGFPGDVAAARGNLVVNLIHAAMVAALLTVLASPRSMRWACHVGVAWAFGIEQFRRAAAAGQVPEAARSGPPLVVEAEGR